jgi:hypothetical protein
MRTVNVIFLLDVSEDSGAFAFFPDEIFDYKGNRTAYDGQHSACHPSYAVMCSEAKPEQYQNLLIELESIGYKLNVLN